LLARCLRIVRDFVPVSSNTRALACRVTGQVRSPLIRAYNVFYAGR